MPAPTPNNKIIEVTKIRAEEFGIKLRLEITGTKIAQTVIIIEPV